MCICLRFYANVECKWGFYSEHVYKDVIPQRNSPSPHAFIPVESQHRDTPDLFPLFVRGEAVTEWLVVLYRVMSRQSVNTWRFLWVSPWTSVLL